MSSSSETGIRERKQRLRKEIRAKVKELTKEEIQEQSQKVWDQLVKLPQYESSTSIGLFLSMPKGEINTDHILERALASGKGIYVPQVGNNFEKCDMEMLRVIETDPIPGDIFHKSWPKNKWGIPEPPENMPITMAKPGDIDLLIVPGLGFDRNCNRLGQGKGYYDRFIEKMTKEGMQLPLVAVCMSPQLIDEDIPVAEYDQQMDIVVTPNEVIVANKK